MDINDYRKKIFLNSQYCTYYNINNYTILAGIMRSFGYRYSVIIPEEKLKEINKTYRKFTAIMNAVVAVEILLYIYFVVFPFFTEFMKIPFFAAVLILSLIPLVGLYVTYIGINYLYENYLVRYVGTFQRTKFKPEIKYINEKAYSEYKNTPRKSVYVLALIIVIFCLYAFVPTLVEKFNIAKKYNAALKLADAYLTFVPISPEVYANRAFAKFNLKKYKEAEKDYENANKYSLSDSFSDDILGVKTYYLDKDAMLKEFDSAINSEKEESVKYLLKYEKATYLLKNKDYKSAVDIYNSILSAYEKKTKVFFSPAKAYYNRSIAKQALGDIDGAKSDMLYATRMCPECNFNTDTTLIHKP